MKILFIIIFTSFTQLFADSKTMTFDDYVMAIQLKTDYGYRLILQEHAAQYIAKKEHVQCLQESMKLKKKVKLTVDPYSLNIYSCLLP